MRLVSVLTGHQSAARAGGKIGGAETERFLCFRTRSGALCGSGYCRTENIAQGGRSPLRPRRYGWRLYSDRYGWWRAQGYHRFVYMERVGDQHVAQSEIMDSSDEKAFEMIWLAFYAGL